MALAERDLNDYRLSSAAAAQPMEAEQEIDLVELLYKLLEKWLYIVLMAILGALIMGIYSFYLATPMYQATAKLYVVNSKDSALNLSDLQIGSYLTSDYQEVFKTWEVHEMVLQELRLGYTYSQLQKMLSVSNPSGTRILNITVTSRSPEEATKIANTYANVAKKYISETMSTDEPNILSVALQPQIPVSPNKTRNVLLGFVVGAFLTVGIITVVFILDDKIKTADDLLKYTNMITLASVPVQTNNSGYAGKKR